ncbi:MULTISPECIES: glycosyltransferase family 4 protein [unclassified Blastococcus]
MRVVLDATPLLGPRTGVGRYVASLARELAVGRDDLAVACVAFTARGRRALPAQLPPGATAVGPPAPARLLHRLWARSEWPAVTRLTGPADVFHATNFVLPPTGRAAGVVTVHDLSFLHRRDSVTPAARAYRDLVPLGLRRARMVLTPSRSVAEELAETYGVAEDRLAVTHLGVDTEWFTAEAPDDVMRRRLDLPSRYFLFVGNLEPRKNLPLLLSAYRALLATLPDAPGLVLVGPEGWGPQLDLEGIPPSRIRLTGYLPDTDVRSAVAGATALVYPTAYEGFGLPPLEALACGTPVVASDLPVIREVVGHDPAVATLVPEGREAPLTDALLRAATEPEPSGAREQRRERARRFDWHATAAATLEAYRRAVSR